MAFQKGQPRHPNAGRKKGSVNKRKLQTVSEMLAESDLHPAQEAIELLQNGDMKDGERAKLWLELLSYCQAKPKEDPNAGDDDSDDEDPLDPLTTPQLLKLIKNPEVT